MNLSKAESISDGGPLLSYYFVGNKTFPLNTNLCLLEYTIDDDRGRNGR